MAAGRYRMFGQAAGDDITRLPSDYEARVTDDNRVFFVNHASEQTQWDSPVNGQRYRVANGLPYGWQRFKEENDIQIFVDHLNQMRSYVDPRLMTKTVYDFPIKYGILDHPSIKNHFSSLVKADDVIKDVDLEGKVVIITGANSGLGYQTTLCLAKQGAQVIMACRNSKKAEEAVSKIRCAHPRANVEWMRLDLASLQSIADFSQEFLSRDIPLHVLVCNAGVLSSTFKSTADGLEEHFGVNHLGHFYLCKLLLPALLRSKPSRVVVISSESHWYPTNYSSKLDLQSLRRPSPSSHRPITAYGASKLCNLLFALEFHRRYVEKGVACNVVHPGNLLPTGMAGKAGLFYRMGFALARPFTKSVEQAVSTIVYCAAHPSMQDISGLYMYECWPVEPSLEAQDPFSASALWNLSEQILEEKTADLSMRESSS